MGMAAMLFAISAAGQTSQDIKFASTPNPVGSGGRAVAWGGAFIAVADDATAASWNPAGLIQLETPECSVVLSYLHRGESVRFAKFESDVETEVASHGDINYASLVWPFHIKSLNLVPSVNYQRLYEFDRKLDFTLTGTQLLAMGKEEFVEHARFEQVGALTTLTPALAVQITPKISLGVSANWWGLDPLGDGWTQQTQSRGTGKIQSLGATVFHRGESKEDYQFSGWNWQAGLLVKPGNFSIGAVYKASFDADVDYHQDVTTSQFSPTDPFLTISPFHLKRHEREHITWPAAYGLGIAYRFSDAFSAAIDAYRTDWSNFILTDEQGRKFNLIAGRIGGAKIPDTTQVRAGMEYLIIKPKVVVALRGGAFYDPEPHEDKPVDFYGVSFGTGFGIGHFVADVAYQYRFGFDVPQEKALGDQAKADVFERFLVASLIYHFK
jgi:long-subunit fatty acid transport protein